MFNKTALLLFTTAVLLTSVAVMHVPQANALTKGVTVNNISTTSFGNSIVCGDHKCAPGEQTKWQNAVWLSQKDNTGKIGTTKIGEQVMDNLAKTTTGLDMKSTSSMPTTKSTK